MSVIQIKNIKIGEGAPKVIVPLMGTTEETLIKEVQAVKLLHPDMIEWRVDVYEHVDNLDAVKKMISKINDMLESIPLLFTFRSHREGGNKEITDDYYIKLLSTAMDTIKIDLIDMELFFGDEAIRNLIERAEEKGVFVVLSNHEFTQTPSKDEIISRLRKMQELGAHIPKIAVMPQSVEDVIILLDATNTMKTKYAIRPIITMSMASTGIISRLSGEVFGSAATFASGMEASAPGQIAAPKLKKVLGIIHENTVN